MFILQMKKLKSRSVHEVTYVVNGRAGNGLLMQLSNFSRRCLFSVRSGVTQRGDEREAEDAGRGSDHPTSRLWLHPTPQASHNRGVT